VRWDLDDLVAVTDLADIFGVGKPAISNWRARYQDFPRPLVAVSRGNTPLYSRQAVTDWYVRHGFQHAGPYSINPRAE
jgi:hypothetical protein